MQGEPESLLEKFMVGVNTVGKGRREGDKVGLGAGNGSTTSPPQSQGWAGHHGLYPGILQPRGKREEGIVSMRPTPHPAVRRAWVAFLNLCSSPGRFLSIRSKQKQIHCRKYYDERF